MRATSSSTSAVVDRDVGRLVEQVADLAQEVGVGRRRRACRGAPGASRRCATGARRGGPAARGCGARGRARSRPRPSQNACGSTPDAGQRLLLDEAVEAGGDAEPADLNALIHATPLRGNRDPCPVFRIVERLVVDQWKLLRVLIRCVKGRQAQPERGTRRTPMAPARETPEAGCSRCTARFDLLEVVAARGGTLTIGEIAAAVRRPAADGAPVARTLVDLGYMRQEPDRRYALGPRLVLLPAPRPGRWSAPARSRVLGGVVDELGETANLAMLDGDRVAYVAQVPGRHSMRMFTEVGRRVHPHCTAVGKAVLLRGPRRARSARCSPAPGCPGTPPTRSPTSTSSSPSSRRCGSGYALDEGEQEVGVRCSPCGCPERRARLGISVSGPAPADGRRAAGGGGADPAGGRRGARGRPVVTGAVLTGSVRRPGAPARRWPPPRSPRRGRGRAAAGPAPRSRGPRRGRRP